MIVVRDQCSSGGKIVVMMHLEAGSTSDDFRKRDTVVVFLDRW